MEKYLAQGKPRYDLESFNSTSGISVIDLFHQLDKKLHFPLSDKQVADACYCLINHIMKELVNSAVSYANAHDIQYIGITGGVSYNLPILDMVQNEVRKTDLQLIVPKRIPNGDGCIAIGQNIIIGHQLLLV